MHVPARCAPRHALDGLLPALAGAVLCGALCAPAGPVGAAPGDLDPTFGAGGKVVTDFGPGSNQVQGLALQPDGKIVAVGESGSGHFALARYLPDGSLDPAFGSGGRVVSDEGGIFERAWAVAVQPDGRLVVVGTTAPGGYCCQAVIARFEANGQVDAGFGTGGKVQVDFGGGLQEFHGTALQPDGRIVAVGSAYSPFFSGMVFARFLPDGTLDPSFDGDGKATTTVGGAASASGVVLQPDGGIVVAGSLASGAGICVARLLPNGGLDPGFGQGGVGSVPGFNGFGTSVALAPDGKIVAGGQLAGAFGVVRFDASGQLDAGFGNAGKAFIRFTGDNLEECNGVAVKADGGVGAVGDAFVGYDGRFAIGRFDAHGQPDARFGNNGAVLTDFSAGDDGALAVALDAQGRIVAGGGAGPCTPRCDFALARYLDSPPELEVAIAIKSARGNAAVNPASHGLIPVWILGAADFDVRTVDPTTVCFGSADGLATFQCSPAIASGPVGDVDGDGFADLALRFDTALARLDATDTDAYLTGSTRDGRRIHGCAPLRIRPANLPHTGPAAYAPTGTDDGANAALELLSTGPLAGAGRGLHVRFRLRGWEPAALQLVDVAGRRRAGQDVGALGPGIHEADLAPGLSAGRGVYWVRLVQAGRTVAKRVLFLAR